MKILHIIFSFNTGGAETMLVDILNEQIKTQKVELLIVNNCVNMNLIDSISDNVLVHFINRNPGSVNPFKILQFNYKVFMINPAIIHFHNHNAIGLLIVKRKVASTCLTIHDVNVPTENLHRFDKLFSISHSVMKDVVNRADIKSKLVYNGVKFSDIQINTKCRASEKFKIVLVSRLDHEKKGQDILMKAISILAKEGIDNIQLDLIGEGSSLSYLIELAKQLNIESYVTFLGMKTRKFIYNNLKNYQLLVQPSIYEGFGLTVVEGMAAKIPVLVSDIEGPMEIVRSGEFGDYFLVGDCEDAAFKIKLIINRNPSECEKGIQRAYQYAAEHFDIKKTAKNYIEEYHNI